MKIIGEKIIGAGVTDDGNAYVTLSSGQDLYLDKIENENIQEELNE